MFKQSTGVALSAGTIEEIERPTALVPLAEFERLYDWYFVPRQPDVVLKAREVIRSSYAEYGRTGTLPSWFVVAQKFERVSMEEREPEASEKVDLGRLDPLELHFYQEAVEWFKLGSQKRLPPVAELMKGAQSYAKKLREDGLTPFFISDLRRLKMKEKPRE